jgi:hypothetical protein
VTIVTILRFLLLALAVVFVVRLAQQIWATARSYRRERQWDELAKMGDATAMIIVQLREKPLRWRPTCPRRTRS